MPWRFLFFAAIIWVITFWIPYFVLSLFKQQRAALIVPALLASAGLLLSMGNAIIHTDMRALGDTVIAFAFGIALLLNVVTALIIWRLRADKRVK